MKVFVIPSWYPSVSNPIYGTFVAEQLRMMSESSKELILGVSQWGQGDDPFLLYAGKPIQSLRKLLAKHSSTSYTQDGCSHYFSPAYTWTKRWKNGNLAGIKAANLYNFSAFIADHGMPDVIHAQASYPGAWVASALSEQYGVPYVVTLRMSPFPFDEYLFENELRKDLKKTLEAAAQLIATSSSLEKGAMALGLQNVQVIHNPVDVHQFYPLEQKTKSGAFNLLAVGRLETQKGFDLLIKAMSKLTAKASLTIIGEGTERAKLHELISTYGLTDQVILLGAKDRAEVAAAMREADGYVLSSRHETFGNVLLEAMASGIPSVATRCGGPEDIISTSTGILCEKESVAPLSSAIDQMISKKWNANAIRQEALVRFSPQPFTEKMMEVYHRVSKSH